MSLLALIRRNVVHYWRTNLAVVAGVAVAVAVLAGALLVGASVRSSLRALALERLGAVDRVVTSARFVPASFGADLLSAGSLERAVRDGRAAGGGGRLRDAPVERPPGVGGAGLRRRRALLGRFMDSMRRPSRWAATRRS